MDRINSTQELIDWLRQAEGFRSPETVMREALLYLCKRIAALETEINTLKGDDHAS